MQLPGEAKGILRRHRSDVLTVLGAVVPPCLLIRGRHTMLAAPLLRHCFPTAPASHLLGDEHLVCTEPG
ncbi:hypothetical protein [Ornithinimicrobium kibberense]|uniref:hypothetical protein n=1 Tax=Ornithinimicrobium kibberense TaxID=282060 RepID=UPI00360DFA5C